MSQEAAVKVNEQIHTVLAAYNEHFANWTICWIGEGSVRGSFEVWPLETLKAQAKTVGNKPTSCRTNRHTDSQGIIHCMVCIFMIYVALIKLSEKSRIHYSSPLKQCLCLCSQSSQSWNTLLVAQTWIFCSLQNSSGQTAHREKQGIPQGKWTLMKFGFPVIFRAEYALYYHTDERARSEWLYNC